MDEGWRFIHAEEDADVDNGYQYDSLMSLRYSILCWKVFPAITCVKPERLPPTPSATKLHSLQVYLQVMQWLGKNDNMDLTKWGYKVGVTEHVFVSGTRDKVGGTEHVFVSGTSWVSLNMCLFQEQGTRNKVGVTEHVFVSGTRWVSLNMCLFQAQGTRNKVGVTEHVFVLVTRWVSLNLCVFQAQGTRNKVGITEHVFVSGTRWVPLNMCLFQAQGTRHKVVVTEHVFVSGTRYKVQGTRHKVGVPRDEERLAGRRFSPHRLRHDAYLQGRVSSVTAVKDIQVVNPPLVTTFPIIVTACQMYELACPANGSACPGTDQRIHHSYSACQCSLSCVGGPVAT
uniref:Uncharacterized protein n=1 Tax=Timema monikensis TaxID=170555 RepID=A0A7R9HV96_9NEOP|nr:unnamed protein product [Timema monikensis]